MSDWIDEAYAAGAGVSAACEVLEISPRTLRRWREDGEAKAYGRQDAAARREPANKLTEQERRQILAVANAVRFAHLPPGQIVPALADQGRYIASESSFYPGPALGRFSWPSGAMPSRRRVNVRRPSRPSAPNRLWSWDISYLAATVKALRLHSDSGAPTTGGDHARDVAKAPCDAILQLALGQR